MNAAFAMRKSWVQIPPGPLKSLFSKSFRRKNGLGARGETGGGFDSAATIKLTPTTEMLGLVMQKVLEILVIFDAP